MGTTMAQVPVTEGVFTWPSETPQLIGARCVACDNHMFPGQSGCPRCTGDKTEEVLLGRRGTLLFRPGITHCIGQMVVTSGAPGVLAVSR